MKRTLLLFLFIITATMVGIAQNAAKAKSILDKTAAIVGRKGGASASFTLSGQPYGKVNGTLAVKGNMFRAVTPPTTVWYNGKTQWSYMKQTNEVSISNPTEAQQAQMNPYKFLSLYKTGYTLGLTDKGNVWQIHLTAQNNKRSVPELYVYVNKRTYQPTQIKMRQSKGWITISISNFKAKNQPNSTFVFNKKYYPSAEIIDLR